MKIAQRYISGISMMLVSVIFFLAALSIKNQSLFDPAGSVFFPSVICLIMFITGVVTLFEGRGAKSSSPQPEENTNMDKNATGELEKDEKWMKKDYLFVLQYFLIVIVYVLLLPYLTFFIASFLFLVGTMMFVRGVSLKTNILVSISVIVVVYVVFKLLFSIVFP